MSNETKPPTRDEPGPLIEMTNEASTVAKLNYASELILGCAGNLEPKERCELIGCLHRVFELLHAGLKEATPGEAA